MSVHGRPIYYYYYWHISYDYGMDNYLHETMDVITIPCPNFIGGLIKLPLILGYEWVITFPTSWGNSQYMLISTFAIRLIITPEPPLPIFIYYAYLRLLPGKAIRRLGETPAMTPSRRRYIIDSGVKECAAAIKIFSQFIYYFYGYISSGWCLPDRWN